MHRLFAFVLVASLGCDSTAGGLGAEPDAGAASADAAVGDDAVVAAQSRCTVSAASVACTHNITQLDAGSVTRPVYWQTPSTPAPAAGYPVVVLFQGSLGGPSLTWGTMTPTIAYGGFYQGLLQATLLDHGFTVIAPEAAGAIAWQTNSGLPFASQSDKAVIDALLVKIRAGAFGPADTTHLYATGVSSGGYMTSRMAVSYPGVFRALAIQSGSYATCLGAACVVPTTLPADHPPTLFLHGALDTTVPLYTAEAYYDRLVADGIETAKTVDANLGHQWLPVAPEKILAFFQTH